jgi:aspartate kinase
MGLIVHKYGGTSVADLEKIENVARKVIRTKEAGNEVVVVLSAMAGETDRLISLAQRAAEDPDPREFDSLISTGEQVTVTLLAMVLNRLGYRAKSFLGTQVKVHTDQAFKKARIVMIDREVLKDELRQGTICVVAGFQGVDDEGNITTLGAAARTRVPWPWRRPSAPTSATSTPTWMESIRRIRASVPRRTAEENLL